MPMILITLSACGLSFGANDISPAAQAAAEKAIAETQLEWPSLPDDCYTDTPHAPLLEGQPATIFARHEYHQLDIANELRYRCAKFYNDLHNIEMFAR